MKSIFVIVFAAIALTSWPQAGDPKKELDALQGNWKVVSVKSADGKDPAEDYLKSVLVEIKGDVMKVARKGDVLVMFKLKVDSSKNPQTIDFLHDGLTSDPDKGKTELGIFKREGDILTICANGPGEKDRPAAFATQAKSKFEVTVLQKTK